MLLQGSEGAVGLQPEGGSREGEEGQTWGRAPSCAGAECQLQGPRRERNG